MTRDRIFRDVKELCRGIAPHDLAGLPLYVVCQSQLADWPAASCDGYTSPSLDLYLRVAIGPAWQGRGPAIVVNDLALPEEFPEDRPFHFTAVVLHELAHVLERGWSFAERVSVDPVRIQFEALVLADSVARSPPPVAVPYAGHDDRFIRVALHIQHRASRLGVHIGPAVLCAGRRYGLSHASRYAEALGDEPTRFAHMSFRDILTQSPPEEFSLLWHEDVLRVQE